MIGISQLRGSGNVKFGSIKNRSLIVLFRCCRLTKFDRRIRLDGGAYPPKSECVVGTSSDSGSSYGGGVYGGGARSDCSP